MKAEARLKELGFELPVAPKPINNFISAVQVGNLLFLAGHAPARDGKPVYRGQVGRDLTVEEGYAAAQLVALNMLATMKAHLGDLDRVRQVVKLFGLVRCAEGFGDQPKVMNGASDLLVQVFGDKGRHARSAVGQHELPLGITVEIDLVVEVEPDGSVG